MIFYKLQAVLVKEPVDFLGGKAGFLHGVDNLGKVSYVFDALRQQVNAVKIGSHDYGIRTGYTEQMSHVCCNIRKRSGCVRAKEGRVKIDANDAATFRNQTNLLIR